MAEGGGERNGVDDRLEVHCFACIDILSTAAVAGCPDE
jgi:hypothetical protein